MKVVLFCGGRGLRLREHSEAIPKPMVQIGYRPILWHVMRYYAHYGHRDFILCLGYRADAIKDYFLHYDEAASNDFVLSEGGRRVELLGSDIADWRITFADTGLDTTIGERLRRVRHLLEGEEIFLANYGDTLTDAPLDELVETFRELLRVERVVASLARDEPSGFDTLLAGDERSAPRLEVDHGAGVVAEMAQEPPEAFRAAHVPVCDDEHAVLDART
jgi:glucose-1-phosphate cytidylyltransferase